MPRPRAPLRSMLGQMMLVTALFAGGGIYFFAVRPILAMPPFEAADPLEMTVAQVNRRLQATILRLDGAPASLSQVGSDPLIREVRRRNPGFRYHLRRAGEQGGTGRSLLYEWLHLAGLAEARAATGETGLCVQFERPTHDADGMGYVAYWDCGEPRYVEFGGITAPIDVDTPTRSEAYAMWLWSYSRSFLIPAFGLFVLLTAILLVNVIRIRRVARLTLSIGGEGEDRLLPEQGLPNEVVPLVRAVNAMIARIETAQRQRHFFLSAAAHELRTPLTILRTRLEIMEDGALKSRLVQDLSRLTTLSNDLLTLMSIDGRRRDFSPVDVGACCLDVMAALDTIAVGRDVAFRFQDAPEATVVSGDAGLIAIAVTNLVDNALSFAPPGSEIVMSLDGGGGLEVRDFGPGIHATRPDSLFEPFVRFDRRRHGHGLGLAIVKAVADLHGASVRACNAPGGGASFHLIFPHDRGDSLLTA